MIHEFIIIILFCAHYTIRFMQAIHISSIFLRQQNSYCMCMHFKSNIFSNVQRSKGPVQNIISDNKFHLLFFKGNYCSAGFLYVHHRRRHHLITRYFIYFLTEYSKLTWINKEKRTKKNRPLKIRNKKKNVSQNRT